MSTTFCCSFTKKKQGPQADFFDESFAWKSLVLAAVHSSRNVYSRVVRDRASENESSSLNMKKIYYTFTSSMGCSTLDILFSSNHNIHKSSCDLCFWASDPLIDRFYKNLSIKGSEVQKQKPHEFL